MLPVWQTVLQLVQQRQQQLMLLRSMMYVLLVFVTSFCDFLTSGSLVDGFNFTLVNPGPLSGLGLIILSNFKSCIYYSYTVFILMCE